MMKDWLILLALVVAGSLFAQTDATLSLWEDRKPGWRKALSIDDLPTQIFGTKREEVVIEEAETENELLNDARAKVSSMPVSGLVWSKIAQQRRVLLGDVVMREGQAIPSYVFDDNQYYTLMEISQDNLHFQIQTGPFTEPIEFDVPFGLTEPVKNSSDYGSTTSSE